MKSLFVLLTLALLIAGCGRETRTNISGGNGGPGNGGGGDPLTKLQRVQREALAGSVMVLSRFGELEEVIRLSLEDPRPQIGEVACPEIVSAMQSRDTDGRSHLRVELHWESCEGAWQSLGGRIAKIYRSDPSKDAIVGNVDSINLTFKDGRQIWKGPRGQSYEVTGGEYLIQKTVCRAESCNSSSEQFTIVDLNSFALARTEKLNKQTWTLTSEQSLAASFVFLNKELSPEPQPKSRIIWSEARFVSQFVQSNEDNSELISDQVTLTLDGSIAETNQCGFLTGNFAV
ncbi:MAG: hypothetical protein AAF202_09380, partial [Pseudomonadota bacterium]